MNEINLEKETYEVKICDLGFAAICVDVMESRLGTPMFIAPEILKSQEYTTKCDVWSFGIFAYRLLIGHFPFSKVKVSFEELVRNIIYKKVY